jgi:hypothetical protein
VLLFCILTLWAVGRWQENPSHWRGTCEDPGGSLRFEFTPLAPGRRAAFRVRVTTNGAPVLDQLGNPAYWDVWRGDGLVLRTLEDPSDPHSDRFKLGEFSFVWRLGDRPHRGRPRGKLIPGHPHVAASPGRVEVVQGERHRGTLRWYAPLPGRWRRASREDDADVLVISSEALRGGPLEIDGRRHGRAL